ncbi:MAG: alkaline phosphatase family protein [Candidatus Eisenbacteria bacterium]|nr:alkaline phosphatase family protein [Candidatus Eisenbacteria bacterium]
MTKRSGRANRGSRRAPAGNRRVLLVGVDIADGALIDRWCREGHLPHFRALREEGVWGEPRTAAEILHVSAWPTVHTGTLPGKHGIYHAYQVRAGEQGIRRARAQDQAMPPFWKFLDEAGRRCLVADAFFAHPVEPFAGIQVHEYGTWTWFSDPETVPRAIGKEIRRLFGAYPFPEHTKVLTVPDPRWLRDRLRAALSLKSKVNRWLLREHPWDFAYVNFAETHAAGHYLWHIVDSSYPAHRPEEARGLEHALRDVYAAVDEALGELLAETDDSVHVLVVSADGMGPNYAGCHLIPGVLRRLGVYFAPGAGEGEEVGGRASGPGLLSRARRLVPLRLRQEVTRRIPRALHYRMSTKWASHGIDWERTKAYVVPNANEGYVRLNLKGREPRGIVEPGPEAEELLAFLEASLGDLVNPENGARAAARIARAQELFPGKESAHLPDLVVTWSPEARILDAVESPAAGRVTGGPGYAIAPYYTGNHRPNAFVAARGPEFRAGSLLGAEHLVGLAPTILGLLGCDVPSDMDGGVWESLVR